MNSKCETCANSRIVVSENGFHPICCLSEKKAIDCHIGTKDHYISLVGKCKFDEEITEIQDLGDIKFIDEDGNVTTPADWHDWNEALRGGSNNDNRASN